MCNTYGVGYSLCEHSTLKPRLRLSVAQCVATTPPVGYQQSALQVSADTAHADAVARRDLFDGAVIWVIANHAPTNGADEQCSARAIVVDVGRH